MLHALLNTPCVTHLVEALIEPIGLLSTEGPDPVTAGLFIVSFGDGQIDILSQTAAAPAGFTVTPTDEALSIIPAEDI
ncbi:hypothetical protein [Roseobacter litoralis]|uniref:hypothetical protein n=1 Tax=Roseobacter litoralis TaxID=42443 RepID=UPI0024915AD3|nr:hypothetical protein [Roseobacter litoralis]